MPQTTNTPLKQILTRIALRGRKRGLGILMMSQRSAKVAKDVLTQASLLFLHKVVHPTDMRVYQDLIPLPSTQVEEMVRALQPGQAIVVSSHTPVVVCMRLRHTFHAGSTPTLEAVDQPELRRVDAALLRDLQRMIASSSSGSEESRAQKAERRVGELEILLQKKDEEIAHQAEQIDLLSKLSVSLDGKSISVPEYLQITQATIGAATVQQLQFPTNESVVIEAAPATPLVAASSSFAPINKKKVTTIRSRLARLPKMKRDILNLVRTSKKGLSVYEIAAWLNLAESSVRKNPPLDLITMGLLTRQSVDGDHVYSSNLEVYIAREFPGTDQAEVLRQLFDD